MNKNRVTLATRLITAVCGLSMIAVMFVPLWRIELNAPQYPEGLCLKIHPAGIKGDVAIINGLNHYIGMKTLNTEDFPEFRILPFCIGFFALLFLFAAVIGRRRAFFTAFFLFVLFGIVAMADFWKWEYDYGHNLNPHAAIVVPGMAYQPPLIGYKQLLNFAAYSIPDTGGWIFVGAGGLLLFCSVLEWRRRVVQPRVKLAGAALAALAVLLTSCNTGPQPIVTGKDNCSFCKMTISDPRFGAEIVTATGKVFKFDDIYCLSAYCKTLDEKARSKAAIYLTDFCGGHSLYAANECQVLKSEALNCPMNGHEAAFSNADSLGLTKKTYPGEATKFVLTPVHQG